MVVPVADPVPVGRPITAGRLAFWAGPPALMMAGIFYSGTAVASSDETQGLLIRLLLVVAPAWVSAPGVVDEINHWMRKAGHFSAYAVLAILVARAIRGLGGRLTPRVALAAWMVAVAWASVDEFHQSFSPTRGASVYDVLLDSVGAFIGVLLYFLWKNRSSRRAA